MPLLPTPVEAAIDDARRLRLPDGAALRVDPLLRPAARWWRRVTEEAFGIDLVPTARTTTGIAPDVRFDLGDRIPNGGYDLTVDDTGIRVAAADLAGAHAAAQTLRQLAGPDAYRRAHPLGDTAPGPSFPHARIVDRPRFGWRGVLLDVARHFLPKADVLRFIDLAALHKLNLVQLHLTDDQGWRVHIEGYPLLTRVGSWRTESTVGTWRTGHGDGRPHGGSYTLADLAEMSAYARERGVTLVPEIDVPGHVEAAIAAYPWLGTSKAPGEVRTTWGISTQVLDPSPDAVEFFREVLDEVMAACDSPWIALGGDEVPTTAWRADPRIVRRSRDLGLDDVGDLHGWFLGELCAHVVAAGRRPVVWDEGLGPRLPRDAVVAAWRGWAAGASARGAGHDVVMAPEQVTYLDHRASDDPDEPIPVGFSRTTADVYAFDPWPPGLGPLTTGPDGPAPGRVLGVQAQVWTEHLDSSRRIDYATFPRLAAFAEVAWSPERDRTPGSPASTEFLARMERDHLPRLDAYGVEYRATAGPHPWQRRPGVAGYPRDLDVELATGGLAGVGGWVEGRQGAEPSAPGVEDRDPGGRLP